MPIEPKSGENKNDFISRCVVEEVRNGKEQKQAVAICISKWMNKMKEEKNNKE